MQNVVRRMSLDDDCRDQDVDPWWEDDELLEIRREEQYLDLVEQQARDRRVLIAKLDKQNSWTLVAEFIAMTERENGRPVSKEDYMDQEWNEFMDYQLRLPGNPKAYLLYQFLLVRDLGVCSCIVASLFTITGFVVKFLRYLTHS
jgi:hypothetical protein